MNSTQEAIERVKQPRNNHYAECYNFSKVWIRSTQLFVSDDLIQAYKKSGLPQPQEYRVFGSVLSDLSKYGLIENVGYVKCNYSEAKNHNRPVTQWRSLVFIPGTQQELF